MSNVIEIEPVSANPNAIFEVAERIADGFEPTEGEFDPRPMAILGLVQRCKNAEEINTAQAEEIGRLQNEVAEQRAHIEANK